MEREIDVTPRHLFDWLKADLVQDGPRRLLVRATREYVAEVSPAACDGLDAEDGFVVAITVGLLEVTPASGHPHWVLRLRVEDAIGTHPSRERLGPRRPGGNRFDRVRALFPGVRRLGRGHARDSERRRRPRLRTPLFPDLG